MRIVQRRRKSDTRPKEESGVDGLRETDKGIFARSHLRWFPVHFLVCPLLKRLTVGITLVDWSRVLTPSKSTEPTAYVGALFHQKGRKFHAGAGLEATNDRQKTA